MSDKDRKTEAQVVADLEQKIVKVVYANDTLNATKKPKADKSKILKLAKKIRETYDYNDIALNGVHQSS